MNFDPKETKPHFNPEYTLRRAASDVNSLSNLFRDADSRFKRVKHLVDLLREELHLLSYEISD